MALSRQQRKHEQKRRKKDRWRKEHMQKIGQKNEVARQEARKL